MVRTGSLIFFTRNFLSSNFSHIEIDTFGETLVCLVITLWHPKRILGNQVSVCPNNSVFLLIFKMKILIIIQLISKLLLTAFGKVLGFVVKLTFLICLWYIWYIPFRVPKSYSFLFYLDESWKDTPSVTLQPCFEINECNYINFITSGKYRQIASRATLWGYIFRKASC